MSLSFPGCHLLISSQLCCELEHLFSGTGEQASFLFLKPWVYIFYLFLVELVSNGCASVHTLTFDPRLKHPSAFPGSLVFTRHVEVVPNG